MAKKKAGDPKRDIAVNRKARFNYEIGEVFEAGIVLTGTEVSRCASARRRSPKSYADARGDEIWLINANIPEYLQATAINHEPQTGRESCCCTSKQINKLIGAIEREGMTIVPLKLYFNRRAGEDRNRARARQEIA